MNIVIEEILKYAGISFAVAVPFAIGMSYLEIWKDKYSRIYSIKDALDYSKRIKNNLED